MTTATATAGDDRVKTRSALASLFGRPEVGALIGAIAVALIFALAAPEFRSIGNIGTILYTSATIGVMAVPVALLMVGGEFDLSAGVAVTSSGLTAAHTAWYLGLNVWTGIGLALLFSLAVGAFNGWLLHITKLPSFLVTLATFFVLTGVNLGVTRLVTNGVSSSSINDMQGFNSARAVFASSFDVGPFDVNILIVYFLLLTAVASWVLLRTRAGNWILAVGGDSAAARAVGVPVVMTKVALFMAVGFGAWLLGTHLLLNYNNVQSGAGVGQEFIYIIAAVIGGCLLTGGYGSIVGAAIGALVFGMVRLGISYAGWNQDWFYTFLGVMLLLAVLVNTYVRKKADSR